MLFASLLDSGGGAGYAAVVRACGKASISTEQFMLGKFAIVRYSWERRATTNQSKLYGRS